MNYYKARQHVKTDLNQAIELYRINSDIKAGSRRKEARLQMVLAALGLLSLIVIFLMVCNSGIYTFDLDSDNPEVSLYRSLNVTESGVELLTSIWAHPDYNPSPHTDSVVEGIETVLEYNLNNLQNK